MKKILGKIATGANRNRTPTERPNKRSSAAREASGQQRRFPKALEGNAAWESTKATRRNLSPADAVEECDFLSRQYRRMDPAMAKIVVELDKVIEALNARKVPFVLTGQHGISSWTGRPRATHDVDILVKVGRNYARAVEVIRQLYPELEMRRFAGVCGFFPPGERQSVIDVTYPHRADNQQTLKTAIWVERGPLRYRIPSLEAALANKSGAMLTPTRDVGKRVTDGVDFYNMVKHSMDEGREPIDLARLEALGELVWPGGGGQEILRLVEEAKGGKVPQPLQP
jgi:hypothetical protein